MRRPVSPAKGTVAADAYRTTLEGLFARRRFGMRPGLDVIGALCEAIGHPERAFPSVHITGSKGKGSTAAFTEAVLRAHRFRTGLFTSPHITSYRERIQVDRVPIPPTEVVVGVERIDRVARDLHRRGTIDREPTFFEVTCALAFDWFARSRVEVGVIEVGMGGRLDSTNVLDSRVGVITTIELEHTDVLGTTLEAIAREKVGILKPGMTGVVGSLVPAAAGMVESEAGRAGVPIWHLGREVTVEDRVLSEEGQRFAVHLPGTQVENVRLALYGTFQATNASLAVAAVARFLASAGRTLSPTAVRRGLHGARWPARLERVARRPDLYYDVAHTPESARAVTESLAEIAPLADSAENAIVFGCLRGKDVARILDALSPLAQTLVVVPIRSDRAIPAAELRAAAAGRFPRVVVAPNPADGVRVARAATGPEGFTLVVGSDYLVGELLRPSGTGDEPDLSDPGIGSVPGTPGPPARSNLGGSSP
jgi:dihydrofolate synthase / folylpolyglutamate synthase